MNPVTMTPIGVFRSCFSEKFGIPRQPGLTRHAHGYVALAPDYARPDAFRGIEQFSHLWLSWVFHLADKPEWSPTVRPPRLGGNTRVGVFATRSPFRPNPLGLSVVRFERLEQNGRTLNLHVRGGDLVDGTPILDIKPYIPYADAVAEADGGFADSKPETGLPVHFSDRAEQQLARLQDTPTDFRALIVDILAADPRPAYRRDETARDYGVKLYQYDVKWRVSAGKVEVFQIDKS